MTVSAMEATRRNHHAHAREDNEMDTDRDVIDTTTGSDDHDRVIRIIAARCPEVSRDDIAEAFAADLPVESIWIEISERVIDAIDALDERLAALERTINGGQDDGDGYG